MNSRERIECALNHRQPDRTPMFEYVILPEMASQLLGREVAVNPMLLVMPTESEIKAWTDLVDAKGFESAVRQLATDQLDLACLLGHDMMYVVSNPAPCAFDKNGAGHETENSGDPVENVRHRNEIIRESPSLGPQIDDSLLIYRCLREEMKKRGMDLPILAPAYAHGIWTDIDLMQAMLLEPEVAHEHFSLATERTLPLVDKYIDIGIDQIGVGGDFAGNQPLISPRSYRQFIVPEVRKVSRRVHEAGLAAINASDGNLWSVIDDFLLGCEVDGYLEIDFNAGMDIGKLKERFGDQITFYGNIDCGNILSFGAPEIIKDHVVKCLEGGMGAGGHIFCTSNAITSSIPLENYLTMVNTYRGFFGMPGIKLDN
jgi:hypothetical protein